MKNQKKIIGIPVKIGKLEVTQNDFPKPINWDDAQKSCAELGDGWRLPTKDELKNLNKNKAKIGGFTDHTYWSSTEFSKGYAWVQCFCLAFRSTSIRATHTMFV